MSNLTLVTLAWELYRQGAPKRRIAMRLGKNRETVHLWLKGIEKEGLLPFRERYQRAKKGPRAARQKEAFIQRVHAYCDRHRVARPYKKNEQAYIESFNRTMRKECLGWGAVHSRDLPACRAAVDAFLERYHYHRLHLGLGLRTPLTKGAALSDIYGE